MNRVRHPAAAEGKKIVVIIGAGFAGLNAAKALADKDGVQVVLVDQRNHHLFQPLLYQVATAGLNPADIAVPIRSQFSKSKNIQVHLGHVSKINLAEKYIEADTSDYQLEFDYAIVACGAVDRYFAHPEWANTATGLKSLEQATKIRSQILLAFELAENETDPIIQQAMITFVIVGGGPTGVELAGAIAEISRTVLIKDFKRINPALARVILIEGGDRLISSFAESLSLQAEKDLKQLGVEVMTSTRVSNITDEGVYIGDKLIASTCVFWAAGVQPVKIEFFPAVDYDRGGRIKVDKDYTILGHPNVFVAGDMAAFEVSENNFLPGVAAVAIQGGVAIAKNILKDIAGKPRKDFRYFDKGQMATIGKNRAVAQTKYFKLSGLFAWFAWLVVHILYLIGFKNRASVVAQWIWSYITSKRGARLIIGNVTSKHFRRLS